MDRVVGRRCVIGAAGVAAGGAAAAWVVTEHRLPASQVAVPSIAPQMASPSPSGPVPPPFPDVSAMINGQPLGVGIVTYDRSLQRDWSDIDRWYRRKGRTRPPFAGQPRVHRVSAGNRNPNPPALRLDDLLLHGMVLENDLISTPGVFVIAHHNVTTIRGGAVDIDGVRHDEPLMGIHAPVMPGDTFTWLIPDTAGRTRRFEFCAISVQIIPDRQGEYEKLFTPLPSGKPMLLTYQCHPAGSLAYRRVVRHEIVQAQWSSKQVRYV